MMTDPISDVRKQVAGRLDELGTALVAHGFTVQIEAKFWRMEVRSRADRLAPARTQRVELAPDPSGELSLSWHLVLPGAGDGISRHELIGPEADVPGAVERIVQELIRSPRGGEA